MVQITDSTEREAMKRIAKNERNKTYYQRMTDASENKVQCPTCCCAVNKYYMKQHLLTKRHLKWMELKNKDLKI